MTALTIANFSDEPLHSRRTRLAQRGLDEPN